VTGSYGRQAVVLEPSAGIYALWEHDTYSDICGDYYFSRADAFVSALITVPLLQGFSARGTGGLTATIPGGGELSAGGQVGVLAPIHTFGSGVCAHRAILTAPFSKKSGIFAAQHQRADDGGSDQARARVLNQLRYRLSLFWIGPVQGFGTGWSVRGRIGVHRQRECPAPHSATSKLKS
jgi:hypothetical protein